MTTAFWTPLDEQLDHQEIGNVTPVNTPRARLCASTATGEARP